jgi:hypothetical protein
MRAISKRAVFRTDEREQFNESLGGVQRTFRLSIDPWDLRELACEANRLGLDGRDILGFGYDLDSQTVWIGPKVESPWTWDRPTTE